MLECDDGHLRCGGCHETREAWRALAQQTVRAPREHGHTSDGDRRQYTLENNYAYAHGRGLVVVHPEPQDVFVDLDTPQDAVYMERALRIFARHDFALTLVKTTTSVGGNQHAYLRAPRRLTALERLLIQACLGSDRVRELLGFLRVTFGVAEPVLFFEKPEA